ncbi:MAG: Rrf2 family transcriptional regulator [Rectinema sp.]|nr:Rrf2 family transcriptional regulator [Rectinema sp.]
MRATARGLYAVKSMLTLVALTNGNTTVSLHHLADIEGISPQFLQQIFYRLRKKGIIAASRGPGGGFRLARSPEEITMYEILEAAGETLEISPCSPSRKSRKPCPKATECIAGVFWAEMEQLLINHARSVRLSDLGMQAPT